MRGPEKKKNESNIQCRTVSVSQYEANPTTNNINYKKQHKNIEAQVHLTKGQNDRQSDREPERKVERECGKEREQDKPGGIRRWRGRCAFTL